MAEEVLYQAGRLKGALHNSRFMTIEKMAYKPSNGL